MNKNTSVSLTTLIYKNNKDKKHVKNKQLAEDTQRYSLNARQQASLTIIVNDNVLRPAVYFFRQIQPGLTLYKVNNYNFKGQYCSSEKSKEIVSYNPLMDRMVVIKKFN